MRAAVYRGIDRVEVEDVPVPEIGPGELLVKVHACGVCGTDLKKIHYGLVEPPRIFGHETAGTVAAVSEDEQDWVVGNRVIAQHHVPCGDCFYCERRLYANCPGYKRTGVTAGFEPAGGGFAEYVRVMAFVRPGVVRIPDDISFEEATFLEPLNTVLKGVETLAPSAGDTALVLGQGPIGLLFTQCLRLRGARVIAADPMPFRREMADRFGAIPIGARPEEVTSVSRSYTEGRGADLAVVAVANPDAINVALEAVRPAGKVLLFAQTRSGELASIDVGQVCVGEKAVLGSYSADIDLQPAVAELLFSRRIDVRPLISHRFPLESIPDAIEVASHPRGDSLKVIVQP
jgi:L-iditol 2-dehydrogenase